MSSLPCARCGGNEVIPDAEVRDYDASSWRALEISVPLASPQPSSFLGLAGTRTHESGTVRARVCATCGSVELYSPEATALWAAYRGR
jgi:hypothetical protein